MTRNHSTGEARASSAILRGLVGLCMRDIRFFNQASLANRVWRILCDKNLLISRVTAVKYGISPSRLFKGSISTPSYASRGFRSIAWGIQPLKSNCRWIVGNGNSIKLWTHPWIH